MANISATYSNQYAGRLQIDFSATFVQNGSGRDAGFPTGVSDMLLCATINGVNTPSLSRNTPSVYAEIDYPGGGVVWNVATTVISTYTGSGVQTYGFKDLKLILRLEKK